MSAQKLPALQNIIDISVTDAVFQLPMSWLKSMSCPPISEANISFIVVTDDLAAADRRGLVASDARR